MSRYFLHLVAGFLAVLVAACSSAAGPVVTAPAISPDATTASDGTESSGATESSDDAEAPTEPPGPNAVRLSSADYEEQFQIVSCETTSESELDFQAENDEADLSMDFDAVDNEGTVVIEGGNEQDGISLNGTIVNLEVNDVGNFSFSGTFGEPNFAGESFSGSGSCA